jgi:hypothetical protein
MEKDLYQEILSEYIEIKKVPNLLLRKIKKSKIKKLDDGNKEEILSWLKSFRQHDLKKYLRLWNERTPEQWDWFQKLCPDAREFRKIKRLRFELRKIWIDTMPEGIKYESRKTEKTTLER